MVITPASQAGDGGSIPLTRSIAPAPCSPSGVPGLGVPGFGVPGRLVLLCTALVLSLSSHAALPTTLADGTPLPSLAPVVEQVVPAVVNIETYATVQIRSRLLDSPVWGRYFRPRTEKRMQSAGSGVIIDAARGYILTNYHLIESAEEIQINLEDRRVITADIVGFDKQIDLAVLQVEANRLSEIEPGDSDTLAVGDFVLAIGNPFRFESTVTSGIVSALGRGSGGGEFQDYIQTDASINAGNSGGPLVDLAGRLVGINTSIYAPGGGSIGIGFAIPSNLAYGIARELIASGSVHRGQLGIWVEDITLDEREALGISTIQGVRIRRVTPGSIADAVGINADDLLLTIEGRAIRDTSDYASSSGLFILGQTVNLELMRDEQSFELEVLIRPPDANPVEGERVDARFRAATLQNFVDENARVTTSLGVLITDIKRGSYAWRSGFRAGDILTSVNRSLVRDIHDLLRELQGSRKDAVIGVYRSGARGTITLRALSDA